MKGGQREGDGGRERGREERWREDRERETEEERDTDGRRTQFLSPSTTAGLSPRGTGKLCLLLPATSLFFVLLVWLDARAHTHTHTLTQTGYNNCPSALYIPIWVLPMLLCTVPPVRWSWSVATMTWTQLSQVSSRKYLSASCRSSSSSSGGDRLA